MTDLDEYLKHNVEGHLFRDLVTLTGTTALFPTVMACCAGIELLGALVHPKPFNADDGRFHFKEYWTRFLYPGQQQADEVAAEVYRLVRHGLAHGYVLKGGFGVGGDSRAAHLSRGTDGVIVLNAKTFAGEFMKSYTDRLRPEVAANSALSDLMTSQLIEIRRKIANDASRSKPQNFAPSGITVDKAAISRSVI